jgi:hypothetical protein
MYGIPASGLPGEENDDESDLGDPILVADNGDTSADGGDIQNADEVVSDDGGLDLGGGDDLLG